MFQNIQPHILNTQYTPEVPLKSTDYIVIIQQGKLLLKQHADSQQMPTFADLRAAYSTEFTQPNYLLSIEQHSFFTYDLTLKETTAFKYASLNALRTLQPEWLAFAAATAAHLANWYLQNRYCGHCGQALVKGTEERNLICTNCGAQIFPKISPAIIVGVKRNNQLLLTKYAVGYDRYALIAGLVEIGET